MQSKNIVTLSAAGSGKTTELIDKALSMKDKKRVLLCTYTNKNLEQLKELIYSKNKFIPQNVELLSWYVFLLQECVRPYQNKMGFDKKISGIEFSKKRCLKKEQYLNKDNNIYVDKISEFAFKCNEKTNGLVVNRLSAIYGYIMIDEFQDLSGYDLDLLDILFDSQNHIYITLIGDPRQATFSTNNAGKNRQYRKRNIFGWLKERKKKKIITLVTKTECYRCNQKICDLADSIYPEFQKTVSKNDSTTKHDGVFEIKQDEVKDYIHKYKPKILRNSKKVDTLGFDAINIGVSKGLTFDRVLLFPTQSMSNYLKTRDLKDLKDKAKLYIAITRARYSFAFILK